MARTSKPWPAADLKELMKLGRLGFSTQDWTDIGAKFGRTAAASKVQYFYQLRKKNESTSQRAPSKKTTARQRLDRVLESQRPDKLPNPQSITALILGDPLPGRSALDRIRAGLAEPIYLGTGYRYPMKVTLPTSLQDF